MSKFIEVTNIHSNVKELINTEHIISTYEIDKSNTCISLDTTCNLNISCIVVSESYEDIKRMLGCTSSFEKRIEECKQKALEKESVEARKYWLDVIAVAEDLLKTENA